MSRNLKKCVKVKGIVDKTKYSTVAKKTLKLKKKRSKTPRSVSSKKIKQKKLKSSLRKVDSSTSRSVSRSKTRTPKQIHQKKIADMYSSILTPFQRLMKNHLEADKEHENSYSRSRSGVRGPFTTAPQR